MPNLDVCTAEEKSKVHTFLKSSFERLSEADRVLPQVCRVEELAKKGIGIHHGGLLPVVKEAVEIMFSRGLVKILFATETFAMGVNMPARSVIFTSWTKHDGTQRRTLLPSEYTQMAGRAGRRGLDTEGHVYILCGDDLPAQKQITGMMTNKAEPLNSRFRITFAMILQLKRFSQSGVRVEDLLGRSFLENARAMRRPEVRRDLACRTEQLGSLPTVQCIFGEPHMEEYAAWESESRTLGTSLHLRLLESSKTRERSFCPGRVLRVFKPGCFASADAALLGFAGERRLFVAVLLPGPTCEDQDAGSVQPTPTPSSSLKVEEGWVLQVEELPLSGVLQLFEQCVDGRTCMEMAPSQPALEELDSSAVSAVSPASAASASRLGRELLAFQRQGLQPLVMSKTLKQVEIDFYETLLRQRELQSKQEGSKCHACPLKLQHYDQVRQRSALATDIEDLYHDLGSESLGLLPQLQAKERVLSALGCLDHEGLITLKGRAVTEVLSGDEITIAEVVFQNILDGCTAQEVASAISAFVFPDKVEQGEDSVLEVLPENLARVRTEMLKQHRRVEELLQRHRVEVDSEEFLRTCNVGLMGIAYRWACGENLADIMPDTTLQEGAIVRAIVRAEELLKKLHDVAKMLGNTSQQLIFAEAAEIIHRDIAFVPSLYIKVVWPPRPFCAWLPNPGLSKASWSRVRSISTELSEMLWEHRSCLCTRKDSGVSVGGVQASAAGSCPNASSSSLLHMADGTRCEGCGTAFGMLTRRQRCGSCDRSLCGSCLGSSLAVVGISCLCGSTCPQCRVLGERSGEFEKCRRLMEDGVSVTLGLPKKGGLFGAAADRRKLPVWLTLKCCGQVAELSWGSLEQRAGRPAEEGHFSVSEVLAVRNTGILLELSIKGQTQATTLDFGTPAERDAWSRYIDLALEVLTPECERGDRDVARADHRRGEIEERRCLNEDRKKKLQENLGMRFTAEAMLSRGSKG
ncbi:unnamed protein product [Polarella glacialis]|uniref:Helicase C-terminal domain-containing protein n=1 Tax=Polarella glacialis TaxID=89957 RepID=A0A813E2Q8_POLGL|nr:unnamed protein product [Polarella glacialis]